MKRTVPVLVILCALAAALCLFSCGKKRAVAASVGKEKIYVDQIGDMVRRYVSLSRKLDSTYSEPRDQVLSNMRQQFLDGLIDRIIILEQADKARLRVTDEELDAKISMLRKANTILEEESFNRYLKDQGMTPEKFKQNIRELMLMEKYRDKIASELSVPDSESQAYYAAHPSEFTREVVSAAHILLQVPDKDPDEKRIAALAADIASRAKAGADFGKLAAKYSQDPSAKRGGDLGLVQKGVLVKEFDQALFSLKKNGIAGPVRTPFGFHVIKALDDPRREVRPLGDVKDDVKRILANDKIKNQFKALREAKRIKVLWDFKN
jgi:parvulin-like peptidyl-prolyl isomerase